MLKAAVFDLDGTIIDSEGRWESAFAEVMERRGEMVEVIGQKQPNGWWHMPGMGVEPNWRRLVRDEEDVSELARETMAVYQKEVEKEGVSKVREGVVEAIEKVKEKGLWTELCTGSAWGVVEKELEELNLYLAFDVTTTGEEVDRQKPDPQIYLLACQKLGIDPDQCVVVEDAVPGVEAGVGAGMQVIGLTSAYATRKELEKAGANWVAEEPGDLVKIIDNLPVQEEQTGNNGEEE
jgi:beta-phosphoglucomutase